MSGPIRRKARAPPNDIAHVFVGDDWRIGIALLPGFTSHRGTKYRVVLIHDLSVFNPDSAADLAVVRVVDGFGEDVSDSPGGLFLRFGAALLFARYQVPDSKNLEADWVTLKCGNYNKVTKKCGGSS